MKKDWTHLEAARIQPPHMPPTSPGDHWGLFEWRRGGTTIRAMAVDGEETQWEHVSVTVRYRSGCCRVVNRTPTWEEMAWIKRQFWDDDECVVEFHPAASDYVNNHSGCLHLWKWTGGVFPTPPPVLVGIKELGTLA